MSLNTENKNLLSLELIKGIDKNGISFTAYLLCNAKQKLILQSKCPVDLTGFQIVFKKIGDITDQEHQEVLEYFQKTYLKKPLDKTAAKDKKNSN